MTIDTQRLRELALIETRYKGYFVDASGNVWSSSNWRGYGAGITVSWRISNLRRY